MKIYKSKVKKIKFYILFLEKMTSIMKKESRKDLVSDQFIQLSALKLKKDQSFRPHFHIWKNVHERTIAQESWVIINGSVKWIFYDLDQQILAEPILEKGDCSVTLEGGHTYTILKMIRTFMNLKLVLKRAKI